MKKISLLIALMTIAFFQAQIINIPDANLKAKLLAANTTNNFALNSANQSMIVDTNGDQEIQVSEALNVYKLYLPGQAGSMISDLTGINQFVNLVSLSVFGNALTNFQINGLPHLQVIHASNNQLTTLSVSNVASLQNINFSNNQVSGFSIVNAPNLQTLSCSNNLLTAIDLSGLPNLVTLECNNNLIGSLTLNNNNNLLNIVAVNNKLTSVAFEHAPNLANLYVNNNLFTTIDAGQLHQLGNFNFSDNPNLTSFNIKNGKHNYAQGATPYFSNTPNLHFVCADDFESAAIGLLLNYFGHPNVVINSYCSFTPGGNFYTLQGNTRYDINNNGCDVNDPVKPFQKFAISSGYLIGHVFGNAAANHEIYLQAGNYTITPVLENASYFTVSPPNAAVNFPAQASPLTQNFCITANGTHNDLEALIIPLTAASPGFDAKYKIIYKNKGTHAQSGTVSFSYNDNLTDYLAATMTPASQSTGLLNWNFSNLLPFETREITVTLKMNTPTQTPALNGGDILYYTAQVNGAADETSSDNTFTLNQTVVNSFDPNDKTCLEGNSIALAKVGDYVHYLVRFENTGTANAQNIVVKDEIDASKFDISSLISLHGSHNFVTRITGNTVEFIFENIQLPFNNATNDGYVSFKIKTKSALTAGDSFSNTAKIYFDYNFPIVTNTYTTTVQNILAAAETGKQESNISVYPNPVKDTLYFRSDENIIKAEMYDVSGRIISSVNPSGHSLDVSHLAKGNYLIRFSTKEKSVTRKFIKN